MIGNHMPIQFTFPCVTLATDATHLWLCGLPLVLPTNWVSEKYLSAMNDLGATGEWQR